VKQVVTSESGSEEREGKKESGQVQKCGREEEEK
jgi:hypothetical protein